MRRTVMLGFLLLGSALLGGFSTAQASDTKIAVVDMNRAMNDVKEGKEIKARLEKQAVSRREALEKKGRALEEMQKDFERKVALMSDEAKRNRAMEIQEQAKEFEKSRMDAEREMMGLQNDLQDDLTERLKSILVELAGQKGYTMVVEKQVVWYSDSTDDLTAELVEAFDAKAAK